MYRMTSKPIKSALGITFCILAIPAIAMLFFEGVAWGPLDFIIAGILFFGVIMLLYSVRKRVSNKKLRIALIVAVVVLFLLLWAELAVGVFNSPLAGN